MNVGELYEVSRNSKYMVDSEKSGVEVPSQAWRSVTPETQTASRMPDMMKVRPTSKNAVPSIAGAPVGRNCKPKLSPFAFANTLAAGVIGQVTPAGSHVPAFPARRLRLNAATESLNVFPYDGVELVESVSRSKVTDQSKTSPAIIDAPAVDVAVAEPLTVSNVDARASNEGVMTVAITVTMTAAATTTPRPPALRPRNPKHPNDCECANRSTIESYTRRSSAPQSAGGSGAKPPLTNPFSKVDDRGAGGDRTHDPGIMSPLL